MIGESDEYVMAFADFITRGSVPVIGTPEWDRLVQVVNYLSQEWNTLLNGAADDWAARADNR